MFCSNCGAQINESSRFCENCGCAVANAQTPENLNSTPENSNPYVSVTNPAPVQNVYNQPQNSYYYTPQAPAEPTYQPQQNFPNTPPQYLRPVQTPTGFQYMPVEPVASVKAPAKYNPFVFIATGVMGLMFILSFMPWFTADGVGFNLFEVFSDNIYLERFEMDAMGLCSFMMLITMGLLIPGVILALLKKNQMPIGFSIATSAITLVALLFFVALVADSKGDVEATSVPAILFFLTIANIIFPIVARNKK